MSTVIEVRMDDDAGEFVCDLGPIGMPQMALHYQMGRGRDCVHALADMPHIMIFGREFVAQFNWQTTVYTGPTWPALIARTGDLVTLGVDRLGDVNSCSGRVPNSLTPERTWVYRLLPMQWWNEDVVNDRFWLGIWPD